MATCKINVDPALVSWIEAKIDQVDCLKALLRMIRREAANHEDVQRRGTLHQAVRLAFQARKRKRKFA